MRLRAAFQTGQQPTESYCFRIGGQGGPSRARLGGWKNGGLEAKVAFHIRPLTPILNDSSLEIIKPLVETRERVTRGRKWWSEGSLSAGVQIIAPSLATGQEADVHFPRGDKMIPTPTSA